MTAPLLTPCPECEAPVPVGEPCEVCEHLARLKARIRFRQRRYTPRGARWAGQQMQKAAYEQPPENQSVLPPSDRT